MCTAFYLIEGRVRVGKVSRNAKVFLVVVEVMETLLPNVFDVTVEHVKDYTCSDCKSMMICFFKKNGGFE